MLQLSCKVLQPQRLKIVQIFLAMWKRIVSSLAKSASLSHRCGDSRYRSGLVGSLFHTVQDVRKGISLLVNPPQSAQQDLVALADKRHELRIGYSEAEMINEMKLVGMKQHRAVVSLTVEKSFLPSKLRKELSAKKVPADVVDAIVEGVQGVSQYNQYMGDFFVDETGTAKLFKATVMMKEDPLAPEKMQLAAAVCGAEFSAAKVVEGYETETVPVYVTEDVVETHTESGFFKDYKKPVIVRKQRRVADKVRKIPIFKEHVFSKGKLEIIQRFLEDKTFDEVKLLYGSNKLSE